MASGHKLTPEEREGAVARVTGGEKVGTVAQSLGVSWQSIDGLVAAAAHKRAVHLLGLPASTSPADLLRRGETARTMARMPVAQDGLLEAALGAVESARTLSVSADLLADRLRDLALLLEAQSGPQAA